MTKFPVIKWSEDLSQYENAVPREVILFGKSHILHAWPDVLFETAMAIYSEYHDAFKKMNERFDFEDIFTRKMNSAKGTRGLPRDLSNPFIVTRKSPDETLAAIQKMMHWSNVDNREIKIYCERTVSSPKTEQKPARFIEFDDEIHNSVKPIVHNDPVIPADLIPDSDWKYIKWGTHSFGDANNSIIGRITYDDKSFTPETWSEATQLILDNFAKTHPSAFLQLVKMRRFSRWFAPQTLYKNMVRPTFLASVRVWTETNHLPSEILEGILFMMQTLGIDSHRLQIQYAKIPRQ